MKMMLIMRMINCDIDYVAIMTAISAMIMTDDVD